MRCFHHLKIQQNSFYISEKDILFRFSNGEYPKTVVEFVAAAGTNSEEVLLAKLPESVVALETETKLLLKERKGLPNN
jgi:hypothetical protein